MYLSKLEIFGFKSFANKINLKFDEGLTGIIGPNGCGKSNVVDAIRWVLGEQRPSVLRCDRMDNVIFNGTATRKPLSLAEVSMYIENNRDILPSEYSELKLTRRLHRSGESEYLINNQSVRLMDIVNLFSDTGMGADAYSVIELKMVEQILSDNAQERRRLFEEAAGIKKYKTRRRSALNKLDTTQQELTRVDDILAEVQKNVNSLSRQVGKARRYHEYREALQKNELLLANLRIVSWENELGPLQNELEQVDRSKEGLTGEVHQLEASLEKSRSDLVSIEQNYRRKAGALYEKEEAIREQQNLKQLRQQRIESFREAIQAYGYEIDRETGNITRLGEESSQLEMTVAALQSEMNTAQEGYRNYANRQLTADQAYQAIREEYQQYVQENLAALQAGASIKEDFQKVRLESENIQGRMERNRENRDKYEKERLDRRDSLARLEVSLEGQREDLDLYQKEQANLEKRLEELREQRESAREEIAAAGGRREKVRSRRDFLENLINSYEGFSNSVQYVMSRKGEYSGVVDTLANLVDCAETYRPALESYLSKVANYLVVREVATAQEILRNLRHQEKGRLSVVPLPLLNAQNNMPLNMPVPNGNTVRLKDVVTYPDTYESLFSYLFRAVFLVPNLTAAIEMRTQFPEATFVTMEGEILEHWGNLTGGSSQKQLGLIGRKEQLQKLNEELNKLTGQLDDHQGRLESLTTEYQHREVKLKEFIELQQGTQRELVELEKQVNRLSYENERLSETLIDLDHENEHLQERLEGLSQREAALQPELEALEAQAAAYRQKEQAMQTRQREAEDRFKSLTQETQQRQITYLNLVGQEKEARQKGTFLAQSIVSAERFIEERRQKRSESQQQIQALEAECAAIDAALKALYTARDAAEQEKSETEQRLHERKAEIDMADAALKKKQRLLNQARERVQELALRIREFQVKLSGIREQITEKYGEDAQGFDVAAIDPTQSIATVQTAIEVLRDKIQRLGDVNPLAVKEYEKEKERLDFLTAQRDDLLSARDQLVETITKLNNTARKQFMIIFEKIQLNFQRVFQEFFDGGKAELVLVESKDPLEANIDINVTHKGKQLKTLTLLSAGEKTLTATSLLFAIYLVKPSPFCILDEVDAPLDDVNIGRLTQALSLFAKDTQFILVTHNKKTMEAARMLYGVTMEEVGVSKIVSVMFD